MGTYICLLLDQDRSILTAESFDAADDVSATQEARRRQAEHSGAAGFELWRGGERIAAHPARARARKNKRDLSPP